MLSLSILASALLLCWMISRSTRAITQVLSISAGRRDEQLRPLGDLAAAAEAQRKELALVFDALLELVCEMPESTRQRGKAELVLFAAHRDMGAAVQERKP